jgi:hypothetical protein
MFNFVLEHVMRKNVSKHAPFQKIPELVHTTWYLKIVFQQYMR